MAQVIADRRDLEFVLFEQFQAEDLVKHDKFKDMNRKMFDMVINEARSFAVKEILPVGEEGDKTGLKFEGGKVIIPECFRKPYALFKEGEWIAMAEDPEYGGQGIPHMINQAAMEYIMGADFAFSAFGMLCHGAGRMIEVFGTEAQKELYLRKMYAGEWSGTMVLTEPGAGSDVGALSTTATKNPDGTYAISGNKMFITGGDHDLTGNIIHPVLARIEGAPAGTKGISLFIVPKIWVNEDGSLGEPNDVVCTGIEEKLGLHASPTCSLTFGGKGKCRGVLLGEENKGMKVMFQMMNDARLGVGALGLYNASSAYLYAVNYARERIQGRDLADMFNKDAEPVAIINHPDVRRMLMWMKSHVEGMRSFIYYVSRLFDLEALEQDAEKKAAYEDQISLLTPIIKSYCTDRGFEVTVQAMQVYGGYGYTADFPIERLLRDSKINSIYEGTNGIQAMDLLGRKLGMKKGQPFMTLLSEIKGTVNKAKGIKSLSQLAEKLEKTIAQVSEAAAYMGETAMSMDAKTAFASASPFLDVMGDMIMAWMLLWRAVIASEKLQSVKGKDVAFYEGQLKSADYFITAILPITNGRIRSIMESTSCVIDIPDVSFGG